MLCAADRIVQELADVTQTVTSEQTVLQKYHRSDLNALQLQETHNCFVLDHCERLSGWP
jgi:hypothetical protein